MSLADIRKVVFQIDETHKEMNKIIDNPPKKIVGAAVIKNKFANKYVENLEPLYDIGAEIGGYLAEKCVKILQVKPEEIESYGKGAIIGVDGEIEHAAALLHPRFGAPVRSAVGSGKSFGKGFLKGTLSNDKFKHVPEQNTDFIFCVLAEEWGFSGCIAFIILYISLLVRMIMVAERQRSKFTRIYGYCVSGILGAPIVRAME